MFKTIEFYAVFLGFVLGIAYDLLEKLFQRDADTSIIDVILTWEYRAVVIVVALVIFVSIIFYFKEKNTRETEEHNQMQFYRSINQLIKQIDDFSHANTFSNALDSKVDALISNVDTLISNVNALNSNISTLIEEIRRDRDERKQSG